MRLQIVVDPLEQHAVVVDRHPGIEERVTHPLRFRRDLARVIEVRLNPDFADRRQQIDQFLVVQPLRQRDGHARADSNHVDVRDPAQVLEEEPQLGCRQRRADRRRR